MGNPNHDGSEFFVALGRVLGGVHYVHDVLAGALFGIIISYVVNKFYISVRYKK